MKYLKLFEDINGYYEEITLVVNVTLHISLIEMSEDDIRIFKRWFSNGKVEKSPYDNDRRVVIVNMSPQYSKDKAVIHIGKLEDEYYTVSFFSMSTNIDYFKCDQLDGVKKLLIDKKLLDI